MRHYYFTLTSNIYTIDIDESEPDLYTLIYKDNYIPPILSDLSDFIQIHCATFNTIEEARSGYYEKLVLIENNCFTLTYIPKPASSLYRSTEQEKQKK